MLSLLNRYNGVESNGSRTPGLGLQWNQVLSSKDSVIFNFARAKDTVAGAERDKAIQLIEAAKDAEQNAIAVKVAASAEKEAALDRAEAITIEARAREAAALAEAEGKKAINEALNTLSAAQIDLQVRSLLLQQLPAILEKAVQPMEKIDSIRIVQVGGLPGAAGGGAGGHGGAAGATFPEQVMNSAMQYQIAKPIVDAVMKDAGLSNEGITGFAQALSGMMSKPSSAPDA